MTSEVAEGPQSYIREQVTNGVAVRMALLYLLDFATPLAFSVSVPSLVTTVVLFACIYGATLLYNMVHIRLANPVELLHGGQKGEKEPKTSWLLTFVAVSYTHLDVYKRQASAFQTPAAPAFRCGCRCWMLLRPV